MTTTAHPRESGSFGAVPVARTRRPRRGLAARLLRGAGGALGALVLFVLVLVLGAVVHLNTRSGRRLVATQVNALLGPMFKGKLTIERVGYIGLLSGVTGVDATFDDPSGRPVLVARGVKVRLGTIALLRSVLVDTKAPMRITLDSVVVDSADVRLDTDAEGNLPLAESFASPKPPGPPDPNPRELRLAIDSIDIGHAWAHGDVVSAPPIDADLDALHGWLLYTSEALDLDVAKARLVARRIASGNDAAGALQGHLRLPGAPGRDPDVRAAWDGTIAGIGETARASLESGVVDATVDVPGAQPADIRKLWPGSTLDRPARAHVTAHGPLSGFDVALHAGVGAAAVDGGGHVVWGANKSAKLALRGHDLDVRELAPSAPSSRLGLTADLSGSMRADGALAGAASIRFLGGALGETDLPPATVQASLTRSAAKILRGDADVVVDEPGAPTHLTAQIGPEQGASTVRFTLDSNVDDFQKLPQLGHGVDGVANLVASGDVDLTRQTVTAQVRVHARDVAQGTTRVQTATVDVLAQGPLAAPELDVTAHVHGVKAGGQRFDLAIVTAKGPVMGPHVTASVRGPDTPDLDASADVALQHGLELARLNVALSRGADRSQLTARSVRVEGGTIAVDGVRVEGLGEPLTASASVTRAGLGLQAKTDGIDLARLARLLHLEKRLQGGTLTLDTDVRVSRGAADGHLTLDLAHVTAGNATDVSGHAEVTTTGRTLAVKVHAEAPSVGTLDVTAPRITVAGSAPVGLGSWREAYGAADIDLRTDLNKLVAMLPAGDVPLSEAGGQIALKAHLARDGIEDVTPDIAMAVSSQHLILAAQVPMERDIDGVLVHPPAPWRLAGVDFAIHGTVDGDTGGLRIAAEAHDAKGPIVALEASSNHVPYADLFDGSERLRSRLASMDVALDVGVPERGLASLPPLLQQHVVTGRMKANVDVRGTLGAPTVGLQLTLRRAGFAGDVTTMPMDVDVEAHYDGRKGNASVKASGRGREMLDVRGQFEAVMADILAAGSSEPPPWTASLRAHMTSFPLGSIATLDDKQVGGDVSGDLALTGLHKDAHVDADLTIDGLIVGSVPYKSAHVQLKADGRVIDGALRIDQVDGFAEAKAHASASWGAALVPQLDPGQPLGANLTSKNLRIAALTPFVGGAIDELDGRLDTNTKIELDPRDRSARLDGTLALTRGTLEASAGGGELHDITANVTFTPDGTITLQKLTAAGMNGQLSASGAAHLSGMSLQSARATVTIPSRSAIPLTVGGTEIGDVDGRIDLSATATPNDGPMDLKVDVPSLDVKLSESATNTPQSLDEMENVRIGAHRGDPARFVLLPLDPKPRQPSAPAPPGQPGGGLQIATRLGQVHVVRGTQIAIDLDGTVKVVTGATTKVTGQIRLKRGGTLDVQGRKFTVQGGTVSFVDDASNPEIVVKANWTAPDGTIVIATFTGPLKTGKVTLTSEPQLPREEIVQLLLFGSASGTSPSSNQGSNTGNSAIATAGGEAAQPLNHMLNQLGLGAVTAKVDTSQAANPKPEVEVQIAKELSLQIAVVLGQPPPGVNPDRTLVTLDWRFLSMWSLATTVGDAGTTIFDVLWQRRY